MCHILMPQGMQTGSVTIACPLPAHINISGHDISAHSSSMCRTVLQRDLKESVVISPPSICTVAASICDSQRSKSEPVASGTSGIGVNIHRSKQGVFVVR